jgi:hypothetical protein
MAASVGSHRCFTHWTLARFPAIGPASRRASPSPQIESVSLRHFLAVLVALTLPTVVLIILDRRLRGS